MNYIPITEDQMEELFDIVPELMASADPTIVENNVRALKHHKTLTLRQVRWWSLQYMHLGEYPPEWLDEIKRSPSYVRAMLDKLA